MSSKTVGLLDAYKKVKKGHVSVFDTERISHSNKAKYFQESDNG